MFLINFDHTNAFAGQNTQKVPIYSKKSGSPVDLPVVDLSDVLQVFGSVLFDYITLRSGLVPRQPEC